MAEKRILALDEATESKDDMYLLVDHGTDGTQKISVENFLADVNPVEIEVSSTTLIINTNLTNGNEVEY